MKVRVMKSHQLVVASVVILAALLLPSDILACPVCFGASDAPAAQGMNMAILVLLGVTGGVLAGFIAFIVYLARRARLYREGGEWDEEMAGSRV